MTDGVPTPPYRFSRDPTFWAVIAGNAFAIVMAQLEGWTYAPILWTYWAQSVFIGIINAYRMYSGRLYH